MNSKPKMQKLFVLSLLRDEYKEKFKKLESEWERFFMIDHKFDEPKNIAKYLDNQVGILFLDAEHYKLFNLEYYSIWQKKFPSFLYVVVSDKRKDSDIEIYRALTDQIIYVEDFSELLLTWNSIAIMRRYWNTFSKQTTIIYKEIIADFNLHDVYLNQVKVELTKKEYEVLKLLLQNKTHYISREDIYKTVWKTNAPDETRQLDQVLSRLKSKIGEKYFQNKRGHGIMLK